MPQIPQIRPSHPSKCRKPVPSYLAAYTYVVLAVYVRLCSGRFTCTFPQFLFTATLSELSTKAQRPSTKGPEELND